MRLVWLKVPSEGGGCVEYIRITGLNTEENHYLDDGFRVFLRPFLDDAFPEGEEGGCADGADCILGCARREKPGIKTGGVAWALLLLECDVCDWLLTLDKIACRFNVFIKVC